MQLAGHIEVTAKVGDPKSYTFTIDGQDFPWFISEDGIHTSVNDDGPTVTVTILAERVTVDHAYADESDPDGA